MNIYTRIYLNTIHSTGSVYTGMTDMRQYVEALHIHWLSRGVIN